MEKYIVYETTNIVNGKIYVGVHKTNTAEFDGYLGSGTYLDNAVKKYGKDNFTRRTLFSLPSSDSAYAKEAEIVNEEFLNRNDVYNMALGGNLGDETGWDKVNRSPRRSIISNNHSIRMTGDGNPMYGTRRPEHSKNMTREGNSFYGKSHTIQTRVAMSESRIGKGTGERNGMFKGWIHTPVGKFPSKVQAKLATGLGDKALNRRLSSPEFKDYWFECL